MSHAIETRGLAYRAGRDFAIRDLALHVPEGSIYGFLGPNGSGKTTTIRLLLGMLRPRSGSISVLGRVVPRDLPAILAQTGYVPERPHLYPHLTVREALQLHAAFYAGFDHGYAAELQAAFALPATRKLSDLSKGEMGKLLVLLALGQRPRLLVLDEPTDGLDPVVRRDVLAALVDFCSQGAAGAAGAATVFISSHLVHELERICDWVGVLDEGRLVAELPMQDFKNGIKRLRLIRAPESVAGAPFVVLNREPSGGEQTWVVRGWEPRMAEWLDAAHAELREVADLDLEDGFVELLRASRAPLA
ncbi:MAG TPA: ABC transporter ATP-binding protein [Candidatus Methylomirabilis sp.]|nr:ABC transporter ATP-binding protein [Candidatus Methylomirabilis sp.]